MLVHAPLNICLGLAGTGYGSPAIVTGLRMGVTAGGEEAEYKTSLMSTGWCVKEFTFQGTKEYRSYLNRCSYLQPNRALFCHFNEILESILLIINLSHLVQGRTRDLSAVVGTCAQR